MGDYLEILAYDKRRCETYQRNTVSLRGTLIEREIISNLQYNEIGIWTLIIIIERQNMKGRIDIIKTKKF